MHINNIEEFLQKNANSNVKCVKISFKKRKDIFGLFVRDADYNDLKSKNFWRVVPDLSLDAFNRSGDLSLARIFNGSEFTSLSTYQDSFDITHPS